MKIIKNYRTRGNFFYAIFVLVLGITLILNNFSLPIWSLVITLVVLNLLANKEYESSKVGSFVCRSDIKNGATFRLEKITNPGNERYYFIYEGSKKIPYYDSSGFESGWYVKDKDGELNKVEDFIE